MKSVVFAFALASAFAVASAQNPVSFTGMNSNAVPVWIGEDPTRAVGGDCLGSANDELVIQYNNSLRIADLLAGSAGFVTLIDNSAAVITMADIDGNGKLDVIAAQGTTAEVFRPSLSSARVNYPFASTLTIASGLTPCHARDIDGDGDLDLLWGDQYRLNDGSGTFLAAVTVANGGTIPIDVDAGDVDGDGDMDFVKTYTGSISGVSGLVSRVVRRNAAGTYSLLGGQLIVAGTISFARTAVEDVNGDGKADILFAAQTSGVNYDTARVGTALGATGPTFAPATVSHTFDVATATPRIWSRDFDLDGHPDLGLRCVIDDGTMTGDLFALFEGDGQGGLVVNRGDGAWDRGTNTTDTPIPAAVLDADADGYPDLPESTQDGSNMRRLKLNVGAAAVAAPPAIYETIGPDYVMAPNVYPRINILSATPGRFAVGHLVTISSPAFNIGQTRLTAPNAVFDTLAAPGIFPLTISTSDGANLLVNVHRAGTTAVIDPASITGGGQSAHLSAPFPQPIHLELKGPNNQPLVGVRTAFASGTPPVAGMTATPFTDASGGVSYQCTAGGAALGTTSASISVPGTALTASYPLTITGPTLSVLSGAGQSTYANTPFSAPIVAVLHDAFGNPFANVAVSVFPSVPTSIATVTPSVQVTDAAGTVAFSAVAGSAFGTATFTLSAAGLTPVVSATFNLTSVSCGVTLSGNSQNGFVNQALPAPLDVALPVGFAGQTVTFTSAVSGAVILTPATAVISPTGHATTTAVFGPNAGTFGVQASTPCGAFNFSMTAAVCGFTKIAGDGVGVLPNAVASERLVVGFTGATPPIGTTVTFTSLTPGAVTFTTSGPVTLDAQYRADATVVAGPNVGTYTVRAATYCSFVDFSVIITPTAPSAASGDGQIGYFDMPLAHPLEVQFTGVIPPAGTPVSFTSIPAGHVNLAAPAAVTDANGRCVMTGSIGAHLGPRVVRASSVYGTVDFEIFARGLIAAEVPTLVAFTYSEDAPHVPLIFCVDAPNTPVLSTPWGTIATSVLSPSPTFGCLDGLGLFGPVDPSVVTTANGTWARFFLKPVPLLGMTFVAQVYGYDVNAPFPYDYIVSNTVLFNF